jgi:hypothetical protein
MRIRLLTITAALAVALTVPAWAHHSLVDYDKTTVVTLKGTITEIQWMNPHALTTVRITNPDGSFTTMQVEMAAPAALIKKGLEKVYLKVGDPVTFEVWRPNNRLSTARANGRTLMLADGRRFDIGDLFAPSTVQVAPQDPRR